MEKKMKEQINAIRGFNRFYTNVLGLLDQSLLDSGYSLSEVRVLREIDKKENCTSKYLAEMLRIDQGYLSRMLSGFQKSGLLKKEKSGDDGRAYCLSLTEEGKKTIAALDACAEEQIADLISPLSETERSQLVQDVTSVESTLTKGKNIKPEEIKIRHNIKPGDAGYLTYLHGWIYKEEYGYSTAFEAYVAQSFYEFLLNYKAGHDRLWIAEHNGRTIGCMGVVGHGDKAQLRWFLLHPNYRGLGLGKRLLNCALDFCRDAGYKSAYLDTTSDLESAIGMYEKAGFTKVSEKENHSWKDDLTELEFAMEL